MNRATMYIAGIAAYVFRKSIIRSVVDTAERREVLKRTIGYDSIDAYMHAPLEEIQQKMRY